MEILEKRSFPGIQLWDSYPTKRYSLELLQLVQQCTKYFQPLSSSKHLPVCLAASPKPPPGSPPSPFTSSPTPPPGSPHRLSLVLLAISWISLIRHFEARPFYYLPSAGPSMDGRDKQFVSRLHSNDVYWNNYLGEKIRINQGLSMSMKRIVSNDAALFWVIATCKTIHSVSAFRLHYCISWYPLQGATTIQNSDKRRLCCVCVQQVMEKMVFDVIMSTKIRWE